MSADAHDRERGRTPATSYVSLSSLKKVEVRRGLFLKGPIPWAWLAAASRLPGQALQVAVALWLEHGFTGERHVRLVMARVTELGVTRFSAYRALDVLEERGLIRTNRRRGRCARVELIALPEVPVTPKGSDGRRG